MLATLSKDVFSDPQWIYEPKLDGQRSLVFKRGSSVRLITRNQKDRSSHYPDLVDAIGSQSLPDLIADGEIVAFDGERTSFSRLQERMQNARPGPAQVRALPVFLFLFDLVWLDGYDLTKAELLGRKAILEQTFSFGGPVRYSSHIEEAGELAYDEACRRGWEGLIAKRAASPYVHGRSRDWLKLKCTNEQEFVIVGWTEPQGRRRGLGALLVAYNRPEGLQYAGKVGTGYSARELARLSELLAPTETDVTPLISARGIAKKGVHWVEPRYVAQVGFSEWTHDGRLRHPRYLGLRDDKSPNEVVREGV